VLHREHADLLAGGDAAHRVRHVQSGALLTHDDRPDVGLGGRLDDRVHGIADEKGGTFALQNLGNRGDRLHGSLLGVCC
jgi:hypothetical protein